MIPAGDVPDRVAEDQVEQPGRLLPDGAHIGFVRTVEVDRQQDAARLVGLVGREHCHAQRVDDAHPLDGVGDRAEQVVFMRILAPGMQCAQQQLGATGVGHRVECRHESGLDRGDHQQFTAARQARGIDDQFFVHAGLYCR